MSAHIAIKSVSEPKDKRTGARPDVGEILTRTPWRGSYSGFGNSLIPAAARILEAAPALSTVEVKMGRYLLAWVLGVPAVVLVIIYFFFH
jgi:hypothetical protein